MVPPARHTLRATSSIPSPSEGVRFVVRKRKYVRYVPEEGREQIAYNGYALRATVPAREHHA